MEIHKRTAEEFANAEFAGNYSIEPFYRYFETEGLQFESLGSMYIGTYYCPSGAIGRQDKDGNIVTTSDGLHIPLILKPEEGFVSGAATTFFGWKITKA